MSTAAHALRKAQLAPEHALLRVKMGIFTPYLASKATEADTRVFATNSPRPIVNS